MSTSTSDFTAGGISSDNLGELVRRVPLNNLGERPDRRREPAARLSDGGEQVASLGVTAEIRPADTVDDELVAAFAALIPQLSSSSPPPTAAELQAIVDSPDSVLFLALLDGRIVGSLTLAFYRIPTGLKAWIEDVVVDATARGHGVGEALSTAALHEARRRHAKHVSLTSRPSRQAANRLYARLGFVEYETNVYRFTL